MNKKYKSIHTNPIVRKQKRTRKFILMYQYVMRMTDGVPGKFVSPTEVGQAYGKSVNKEGYHSSVASPVLLSLTRQGMLERNSRGHYRYIPEKDRKPKKNKPKNNEMIYRPSSTIKDDHIIVYGAGKFGESKLSLNKTEASLLYLELHKFIFSGQL